MSRISAIEYQRDGAIRALSIAISEVRDAQRLLKAWIKRWVRHGQWESPEDVLLEKTQKFLRYKRIP